MASLESFSNESLSSEELKSVFEFILSYTGHNRQSAVMALHGTCKSWFKILEPEFVKILNTIPRCYIDESHIKQQCKDSPDFCQDCKEHCTRFVTIVRATGITHHKECCITRIKLCMFCHHTRQLCWTLTWNDVDTVVYKTQCHLLPKSFSGLPLKIVAL